MPPSIGLNLRVTGHCNQGGRKYMEDMFSVAYQQTADDKDLEYAFFGIFDGHGGGEAATYAKENLMDTIVKQKNFWSEKDEDVLRAIQDGYNNTHQAMWRQLDKWPRTASGLPSTAGTTASVAFIRKGKIYIGHVGDSGIILGYQDDGEPQWKAKALTKDHKPESTPEMMRIRACGGKVVSKSGVPRVVWNRPRIGHKGPVRRSTHIDEIPFLAVARSLGDLWSYNSELDKFVVSPEPDVAVVAVDVKSHRCLIFGTDGLWNMLSPQAAVAIVQAAERHNEKHLIASQQTGNGYADVQMWINPSKSLVDRALEKWLSTKLRADNTSVVTLMLDPPGPSRTEVLLGQKNCKEKEHPVSPKGTPRRVILSPVPSTSEPYEPEPDFSTKPQPHPNLYPTKPQTPVPNFTKDESNENESKQPDSSDTVVDAIGKITEVANILHREEPTVAKLLAEHSNVNTKSESHDIRSASKCLEQRHESPHRELRSRESIQVAEVSSSVCSDNVSFEDTKSEDVSTTKLEKIDQPIRSKRILDYKSKESTGTTTNLQKLIRQMPRPSRITDDKAKEESNNLHHMVRQNAFNGSCDLKTSTNVATKRRHSTLAPAEESCSSEPSLKRRTRSEDQRVLPIDENDPANQGKDSHSRLSWPDKWKMGEGSENTRTNQRRSLEKKATPVKTIRRPSINGGSRLQFRRSFTVQRERVNIPNPADLPPQRWLRSDTIAATPIKTLRSRNVDIMGHTVPPQIASQYGIVKANRLSLPSKLKQPPSSSGLPQTPSGSAIAKRVKSSYNPSARSLTTRSRIKRLSK
ncbi:uncharacterized protein LOC105684936 [Athalia rosae]|uniref:uncharacterized protein LOC105684936 n=1 Tax=Athalia rosae TaxID=37344 RepID=UPI0020332D49|nr:uncharacterized protein LOC105684936 [Athalia rosae]XP_048505936.1 uncharacterized protein LOC105684936 [Athalia rosae]